MKLGVYATMYYTTDMKKSVEFYTKTLGFKARFEDDGWTEIDLGNGSALALHHTDKKVVCTEETPKVIFSTANIEKTLGTLKEKRIKVLKDIADIGCGWCATIADPAGNAVGLYQHKEEMTKDSCCG